MKKITEIKEKKVTTRFVKNALGERVRTKVPIEIRRKVNTIQGWARFGHYMIDFLIINGVIFLLLFLDIGISNGNSIGMGSGSFSYTLDFSGYIAIILYYSISEATMGRTIGKMATNSYVIDEYAKKPEFGTIFIRSICRLVPFEAFSCLGERGWHDKWSKTFVVSKTEWEYLKKAIQEDGISDDENILDL